MARAHLFRPITDREGNLLYNAAVTVREVDYSIPIAQPLYASSVGDEVLDNPFTAVNGVIDFWLDEPQRMSILVEHDQVSDILVYLDAPPPPEEIVSSSAPLEIVNTPSVSGQVLLSTAVAGQAQWGNPPSGTGLTPVVVADSQSFNSGGDPAGWNFVQTNGGAHTYDPLSIPPGTNYQYSLRMTQAENNGSVVLTGPTFNLLENGRLSLWLKSLFTVGESFTVKVSDASAVQTTLTTIGETRDWGFYAFDLPAGTYTPIFTYTGPAAITVGDHSVWMTGYVAQYGGNIPPHDHNGSGPNSVVLGTGATAAGDSSTAVGVNTSAAGLNSSAFGYGASAAGTNALAVGYNAAAGGDYSLAVGSGATGSTTTDAWVAVGYGANAAGNEAVAVGKNAVATADYSVAQGSGAQVAMTGTSAVAIGQNAKADGANSVAIGQGAVVGPTHNNSVALGSGAATTSANQIVLGHEGTIATVTGSLQNYGLASLGSSDSRVGFYGTAGNTIQTISGSDDGNVTVRTLVNALAAMGLVINETIQQPVSSPTPIGIIDYFYHQDPGDGTLGISDFDFAPYAYFPLAFSDQDPYPSGPQWYVGADHNGYKGYAGGLGALKNMYNPEQSFFYLMSTVGTGNKICFAIRHTGEDGSAAAAGYLILDQAANTISLGVKAPGDPSNVYTVAAGNSVSLATVSSTPFDGNSHRHKISVSGTSVMWCDGDYGTPIFFRDNNLNLSGTYMGLDFNQTTSQLHNFAFIVPNTFDGFKTTGALSNAPSGEAWWPLQTGAGSGSTVNTVGNVQFTAASGGYSLAYILTQTNTTGKITATRWATGTTPTTAMGVFSRWVDGSNYYFINNTQIIRVLAGTSTVLGTLSQTFVAGDRMLVVHYKSGTINVYRNGTLIGSVGDTTASLMASERYGIGIRSNGTANFSYFWCYDIINGAVTYK